MVVEPCTPNYSSGLLITNPSAQSVLDQGVLHQSCFEKSVHTSVWHANKEKIEAYCQLHRISQSQIDREAAFIINAKKEQGKETQADKALDRIGKRILLYQQREIKEKIFFLHEVSKQKIDAKLLLKIEKAFRYVNQFSSVYYLNVEEDKTKLPRVLVGRCCLIIERYFLSHGSYSYICDAISLLPAFSHPIVSVKPKSCSFTYLSLGDFCQKKARIIPLINPNEAQLFYLNEEIDHLEKGVKMRSKISDDWAILPLEKIQLVFGCAFLEKKAGLVYKKNNRVNDLYDLLKHIKPSDLLTDKAQFKLVFSLFKSVLEAVVELHKKEIVHGDLRPSNYLIVNEKKAKLIDFGLAEPVKTKKRILPDPFFTPPEVASGFLEGRLAEVEPSQDVWALGSTLWFICKRNFSDHLLLKEVSQKSENQEKIAELAKLHKSKQEVDLSQCSKEEALVYQAHHLDPSKRPTAAAFLQAFQQSMINEI